MYIISSGFLSRATFFVLARRAVFALSRPGEKSLAREMLVLGLSVRRFMRRCRNSEYGSVYGR